MKNRGFGLVEVLVASAILALVVGGSIALMRSSLRRTVLAADRTVAMNLAQEAIEAIRSARDTTYTDQINNLWQVNIGGDNPDLTSYKLELRRLSGSSLGSLCLSSASSIGSGCAYGLFPGPENISLNNTEFEREIFIEVPSGYTSNAGININGSQVSDSQVIRKVTVKVRWGDLNNPSPLEQVEAITYLTDWRGGV